MESSIKVTKISNFSINIIGVILIVMVMKELRNIFIPLTVAFMLYFALQPINNYFKNKKIPSSLILIIDLVLIISGLYLVFQILFTSYSQFSTNINFYVHKLDRFLATTIRKIHIKGFTYKETVSSIDWKVIVENMLASTFTVLDYLFFIFFFFIFIFSGGDKILQTIKEYTLANRKAEEYDEAKENYRDTLQNVTTQIQNYMFTKLLNNFFAGLTVATALYFLDIEYAVVWGIMLFLFEFVPTIGSILSLVFPVLMSLIQYESLGYTALILLILIGIQALFFSFIEPKIMGNKLGLNPLIILLSLLLWSYIWGVPGMVLSVPITASLKIIFDYSNSRTLNFVAKIMGK